MSAYIYDQIDRSQQVTDMNKIYAKIDRDMLYLTLVIGACLAILKFVA